MGYLIEPNVASLSGKKQFTIPFADFINIASTPFVLGNADYVITSAFISVINTSTTGFSNFNHLYISSPIPTTYVAYYDETISNIKYTQIHSFLVNAQQPPFVGGAYYDYPISNLFITSSLNPVPFGTDGDILLTLFTIPMSELYI